MTGSPFTNLDLYRLLEPDCGEVSDYQLNEMAVGTFGIDTDRMSRSQVIESVLHIMRNDRADEPAPIDPRLIEPPRAPRHHGHGHHAGGHQMHGTQHLPQQTPQERTWYDGTCDEDWPESHQVCPNGCGEVSPRIRSMIKANRPSSGEQWYKALWKRRSTS